MKNPPFELTNQIVSNVAEIVKLVGRLTSTNQLSANPSLRRSNRDKTVHGSLAIEQYADPGLSYDGFRRQTDTGPTWGWKNFFCQPESIKKLEKSRKT